MIVVEHDRMQGVSSSIVQAIAQVGVTNGHSVSTIEQSRTVPLFRVS